MISICERGVPVRFSASSSTLSSSEAGTVRSFPMVESFALVGCADVVGDCSDAPFVQAPTAMQIEAIARGRARFMKYASVAADAAVCAYGRINDTRRDRKRIHAILLQGGQAPTVQREATGSIPYVAPPVHAKNSGLWIKSWRARLDTLFRQGISPVTLRYMR